jgi:hypothetical protein
MDREMHVGVSINTCPILDVEVKDRVRAATALNLRDNPIHEDSFRSLNSAMNEWCAKPEVASKNVGLNA